MVTQQIEEYLEVITLLEERGEIPTTSSIAREHQVSLPSVTQMLQRLAEQGLVAYAGRGTVTLTREGRTAATTVLRRHRLWERFLHDVLGLHRDRVSEEACRLEHSTSPEVERLLSQAVCGSDVCPHGQPIPAEGAIDTDLGGNTPNSQNGEKGMVRLTDLCNDEMAAVADIPPGSRSAARFLALGFTLGAGVRMIQNFGTGPVVVLVRDTRVAMGRGEAGRILVHKKEDTDNG